MWGFLVIVPKAYFFTLHFTRIPCIDLLKMSPASAVSWAFTRAVDSSYAMWFSVFGVFCLLFVLVFVSFLMKLVPCLQYFMLRIEKMAICSQQASEYLIPRARRYSVYICTSFSSGFNVLGSFYKIGMLLLFFFFLMMRKVQTRQ